MYLLPGRHDERACPAQIPCRRWRSGVPGPRRRENPDLYKEFSPFFVFLARHRILSRHRPDKVSRPGGDILEGRGSSQRGGRRTAQMRLGARKTPRAA